MEKLKELKNYEQSLVNAYSLMPIKNDYGGINKDRANASKTLKTIRKIIKYYESGGTPEMAEREIESINKKLHVRQDRRAEILNTNGISEKEKKEMIESLGIKDLLNQHKFLRQCIKIKTKV